MPSPEREGSIGENGVETNTVKDHAVGDPRAAHPLVLRVANA